MPERLHARSPAATLARADAAFVSELRAARHLDATPGTGWALALMAAVVIAFVAWAALARVDQVTRADGRVIPAQREQLIASLEGGILSELSVREGQIVKSGQALARIDPTRFAAQQSESQVRRQALRGSIARVRAEAEGRALQFPPDLAPQSVVVRAETQAFQARRQALDEALASNRRSLQLLGRELALAERMAAQGVLSEVEVMRLQRQVNELQLQGEERSNRFRQEASGELARLQAELAQLDEQLAGRADVLRRTVLSSPVDGVVKNIRTATLGGVVAPGAAVMEIVPLGPEVLIEARIKPGDIGFVQTGQKADFKFAAYDYTTYGGLAGTIEHISPDALGDADRGTVGEATYYRVLVRARGAGPSAGGTALPVLPGMTGSVEVRTGERSVLSFLLRPMLRGAEAFRER